MRQVELEDLGVPVEIGVLEVLLALEEQVFHLPELTLLGGSERCAGGDLGVNVHGERDELVHEPDLARVRLEHGVDERDGHPTVGTFEVGEFDDGDRRVCRSLAGRTVEGQRLGRRGVEALSVGPVDLVLAGAVADRQGDPLRGLRT